VSDRSRESLFDLVVRNDPGDHAEVRLGVRCVIAGEQTVCPVSPPCSSVEQLRTEAEKIRLDLETAVEQGRAALDGIEAFVPPETAEEMTAEELWQVLEAIPDDDLFVERFNELEEPLRKKVAEHVLTSCSVFSGRPALFSSRYDAETALLGD
jgi:hypothetical protein